MHECFACLHVSTLIPYLVLEEVRRWARSFRIGVPGFCKPLCGFWEPNPDILKNKCSLPPNNHSSPPSNFLTLPRSTCLGMVLPTMYWSLLHQSLNKTISGKHIHKAIWLRQYFNEVPSSLGQWKVIGTHGFQELLIQVLIFWDKCFTKQAISPALLFVL